MFLNEEMEGIFFKLKRGLFSRFVWMENELNFCFLSLAQSLDCV